MTDLHKCIDCAYWEPCFNLFGKPTGQGGCQFSVARNRKGEKLRECDNYASPPLGRIVEVIPQVAMTDLRKRIFHYVENACFMHQKATCPLNASGESYTYENCQRWTCGHVLGTTDKIVALIEAGVTRNPCNVSEPLSQRNPPDESKPSVRRNPGQKSEPVNMRNPSSKSEPGDRRRLWPCLKKN